MVDSQWLHWLLLLLVVAVLLPAPDAPAQEEGDVHLGLGDTLLVVACYPAGRLLLLLHLS